MFKTKSKLEQQKKELEKLNVGKKLLSNVNDIIVIVDSPAFNFTFVTGSCYNLFGYTPEEYMQLTLKDVTPHESYQSLTKLMFSDLDRYKRLEIDHPVLTFEIQLYHKDGSLVWVEISSRAIFNEKNDTRIIAIIRSIEERKAAELKILEQTAELEKQKNLLEILNSTKDKFFSIISHDLKNPFSVLLNMTDLLIDSYESMNSQEIGKIIQTISKTVKYTYDLLENLLLWSRSSTDTIQYIPQNNDITKLILETIILVKSQADTKNITLDININDTKKAYFDYNMIKTVSRNLITNAIKFSYENSKISIKIEDYDYKYYIISVADTGVGIPQDKLDKLFKIGETDISSKGTKNETGTGLGLILCKEFIDKHNCKIWAESEMGKGTTFFFTLPKSQPLD
jgi:two-component system, sensor histidine kinase and response regulator